MSPQIPVLNPPGQKQNNTAILSTCWRIMTHLSCNLCSSDLEKQQKLTGWIIKRNHPETAEMDSYSGLQTCWTFADWALSDLVDSPRHADSPAEQGGGEEREGEPKTERDLDVSVDYWLISEHKQPNKWGHRSVIWRICCASECGHFPAMQHWCEISWQVIK